MKKGLFAIFLLLYGVIATAAHDTLLRTAKEELFYQFAIPQFRTTRQGGHVVNVYVKYAIKPRAKRQDYPDFNQLRETVIALLQPTSTIPEDEPWEFVVKAITLELYHQYRLKGVSVQLMLFPNDATTVVNPGLSEPVAHGPIFTLGQVPPLDVPPPV